MNYENLIHFINMLTPLNDGSPEKERFLESVRTCLEESIKKPAICATQLPEALVHIIKHEEHGVDLKSLGLGMMFGSVVLLCSQDPVGALYLKIWVNEQITRMANARANTSGKKAENVFDFKSAVMKAKEPSAPKGAL